MATIKKSPFYKVVDGVIIPEAFSTECFKSALQYKPQPNDVFIATYPKCGTTWVQNIVIHIFRRGKPLATPQDFFLASPFLEMLGTGAVECMQRPGPIKTHLPFDKTPYSSQSKYIHVARNPKDCCVSLYHHTTKLPMYFYQDASFEDFFKLFIEGNVEFNDYFDHLLPWYHHRHDPNVLFITYEHLKANHRECVLRIAKFLGKEYGDLLEQNSAILDNIVYYTSFDYMKSFISEAFDLVHCTPAKDIDNLTQLPEGRRHIIDFVQNLQSQHKVSPIKSTRFIRKGEVMDWKTLFTPDQSTQLCNKFTEKTKGTELADLWKEYM